MKTQYFGDVNDYRKYGLLRALQSTGKAKLLIAWMLTPDVGGTDGRRRGYLRDPGKWAHYDPELYRELAAMLGASATSGISQIEATDLLPRVSYHGATVPDSREARDRWRENLLAAAPRADLVFLDPDIGIEVPSSPAGRKGSSGYVTWREIEDLWSAGRSLLIYQHFPRRPRELFTAHLGSELRRRTGASLVWAFRTAHVLFLLVAQKAYAPTVRRAIARSLPCWAGQIEVEEPAGRDDPKARGSIHHRGDT